MFSKIEILLILKCIFFGFKCNTTELTFGFGLKQFGEIKNFFKSLNLKLVSIEILP